MVDDRGIRAAEDWRRTTAAEDAEAAYFARKYGLCADQLNARTKLEAAARRIEREVSMIAESEVWRAAAIPSGSTLTLASRV